MATAGPIFWSDLLTDAPAEGAAFHAHVLGWTAAQAGHAVVLSTEGNAVAQVMAVGDDAAPHWLVHVVVDDLAATCRRAAFLQGQVLVEAEAVAGLGAGAILADPAGCVLHMFQPEGEPPRAPPLAAGRPAGALLLAPRVDLGVRYYSTLLGWKAERVAGKGAVFLADGAPIAVAVQATNDTPAPAQWMPLTAVADLEATLLSAIESGGQLLVPLTELPLIGTVAAYLDAQGAPMGLRSC